MIVGSALQPYCLPNTAAGRVENVRETFGLLPLWDALIVCWIEDKHLAIPQVSIRNFSNTVIVRLAARLVRQS